MSPNLDWSSVNMGENPFLEYAKFDGKVGLCPLFQTGRSTGE